MVTTSPTDRESMLVELVDESGHTIGAASVRDAHSSPGLAHRAYSVILFDKDRRVLLQRRAAVKTRFPSRWSNACCGHPAPGETVAESASRRLIDELGVTVSLSEVGVYRYRAEDPVTRRVEDEWDHVLVGVLADETPRPNPAEVSETVWVAADQVRQSLEQVPEDYTPWLSGVLRVATVL